MAFPPTPPLPPRGARGVFSNGVDAFIRWMSGLPALLDAFLARLETIAAGGAYSIPYVWGAGVNTGGGTSQSNSPVLAVNNNNAAGVSVLPVLQQFDSSSSSVKGTIRVVAVGDASRWIVFDVASRVNNTGYQGFTGAVIEASSANPFVEGDSVMLFFQRTGDKGQQGDTGAPGSVSLLVSFTNTSPVAAYDYSTLFTDTYNKYIVEVEGMQPTASDSLCLRVAAGGVVDATAIYYNFAGNGDSQPGANTRLVLPWVASAGGINTGVTATYEIRNARSTSKNKAIGVRGNTNTVSCVLEGSYGSTNPITGVRLFFGTSNIASGAIRIYGVKA